ncbi:MAG TPA: hypothetical protein VFC37_18275 [Terracidiphilus sp.]|nr:hypothetical protein [Terracidiphilus sp.]
MSARKRPPAAAERKSQTLAEIQLMHLLRPQVQVGATNASSESYFRAPIGLIPAELEDAAIFHNNHFALLEFSFFVSFVLAGRFLFGNVRRILQFAHSHLRFAFNLLNRASHLGSGVPGQVSKLAFGASRHFVYRAFHFFLVHHSTSKSQLLTLSHQAAV